MANSILGKIYESIVDAVKYCANGVVIYQDPMNQNTLEGIAVSTSDKFDFPVKITGMVTSVNTVTFEYNGAKQVVSSGWESGVELFSLGIEVSISDPSLLVVGDSYDIRAWDKTLSPAQVYPWVRSFSSIIQPGIMVAIPESEGKESKDSNAWMQGYDAILYVVFDYAPANTTEIAPITRMIDWCKDVKDILVNIAASGSDCLIRDLKIAKEIYDCPEIGGDSYRAEHLFVFNYEESETDTRSSVPV